MRVYVKQNRTGKYKWYIGDVIGRRGWTRRSMSIFDEPAREWQEDKLLVKMSDHSVVTAWESDTYLAEPQAKKSR